MEASPRTHIEAGPAPAEAAAPAAAPSMPHGVAALIRRWAEALPEEEERRWLALIAARRVEGLETHLGGLLARPLRERGFAGLAARVERNPLATLAGMLVGGWLISRLLD